MMKTFNSIARLSYVTPCCGTTYLAGTSAIMTSVPEGYGDPGAAGQNGTYTDDDVWSF